MTAACEGFIRRWLLEIRYPYLLSYRVDDLLQMCSEMQRNYAGELIIACSTKGHARNTHLASITRKLEVP